jgi:hypothetical protein
LEIDWKSTRDRVSSGIWFSRNIFKKREIRKFQTNASGMAFQEGQRQSIPCNTDYVISIVSGDYFSGLRRFTVCVVLINTINVINIIEAVLEFAWCNWCTDHTKLGISNVGPILAQISNVFDYIVATSSLGRKISSLPHAKMKWFVLGSQI